MSKTTKPTIDKYIDFINQTGCHVEHYPMDMTSTTKLDIKCKSCGNIYSQSYKEFKQQKKFQCWLCSAKQNGLKRVNPVNKVEAFIESKNCKLMSPYINSHSKIKIECSCGNIYEQSLSDFRSISRNGRPNVCPICAHSRAVKNQTYSYEQVKNFIDSTGCELMSTTYRHNTDKLDIKCRMCSSVFANSLKDFKNNGTYACANCTSRSTSTKEKQLAEFVKNLGVCVVENDVDILNGKELDILINNSSLLAIEYNGMYFHSEKFNKDKSYHLFKTLTCEANGVNLMHVWEHQWNNRLKQNIIKSMIKAKVNKIEYIISARKCHIQCVDIDTSNIFLENNHLHGKDNAQYCYGLYYNNDLVMVMTFSELNLDEKFSHELSRLCTKIDTIVVGGASKLLKHFVKQMQPVSIITFADRSLFSGDIYNRLGFSILGYTSPDFKYTKQNRVYDKNFSQVNLIRNSQEKIDVASTDQLGLESGGYYKIWDCGNIIWGLYL